MERLLDLLCDAPIGANARPPAPDSPARQRAQARLALLDQLRARLEPEDAALLDAYFDLEDQSDGDFALGKFRLGFCLGASLLLEVLEEQRLLLG